MKNLKTGFAVLFTTLTLAHSTPSHALIGLATGNPALTIGGVALTLGGTAGTVMSLATGDDFTGGFSIFGVILGLVVLDGQDGQKVEFSEIDEKSAQKMGLTENERLSYNSEIDQVNFIAAEIDEEISKLKQPSLQDSAKMWEEMKDMLSSSTFTALQKISQQMMKK